MKRKNAPETIFTPTRGDCMARCHDVATVSKVKAAERRDEGEEDKAKSIEAERVRGINSYPRPKDVYQQCKNH